MLPVSHRFASGAAPARAIVLASLACAASFAAPAPAAAQEPAGVVQGTVLAGETGAPLPGARVRIPGTDRVAVTNAAGAFRITDVPAGSHVVVIEYMGRETALYEVSVAAGQVARVESALAPRALRLADVVISVTREYQDRAKTPATVGVVDGSEIREIGPTHPSEIMGRIPGVWVNVTGGEGHMTAIRQPLTTDPVYLYAEDGVPTRSTGFFNHNALYEVNVPQAERIEVVKGPGTALYGSDALAGVVNVQTRSPVASPGLEASVETGAHGFARVLGSYALANGGGGLRADVNVTRTDGWRDGTAFDRQSGTLRWDHEPGPASRIKAVASVSRIDQQTAGSSRLPEELFRTSPTRNLTPISFRDVRAARLSVEYERRGEATLFSVTPYARANTMHMLPNWMLNFDPVVSETGHRSLGVLARWRRDLEPLDARLVVGLDVDRSPGSRLERSIATTRSDGAFTAYEPGDVIYDYDVTFLGVSPYLHAEASPLERLRLTAGLRFDALRYDYRNRLGEETAGPHRRPASTRVGYAALSPNLGATYDLGRGSSVFAAAGRGFRAPSEGQLFRQGPALGTVDLEPVRATNYEAGIRGRLGDQVRYEAAVYRMAKTNDILSYQRPDDNRETRNAGETLHRGVELGLGAELGGGFGVDAGFSYAKHTFGRWSPDPETAFDGNEMESAPRTIGNTAVRWAPRAGNGPVLALEWVHLGAYWVNAANTERYGGHDLLNLRASWPLADGVTLFGRLNNVTDRRYAESAGWSFFRGFELAPGMPRTLYVGARFDLSGGR